MRKLKLQMQMSIDGFVAGPNGEMDWMIWDWDDVLNNYVDELTDSIDTILLGKNLALGFIPHWTEVANDSKHPENEFGQKMIDTPKVVLSKTLFESPWVNTAIASGDLTEEITKLKQQTGKDLIVYGGAGLVSSLITHNLIDEFHLFVNPALLGEGMKIFNSTENTKSLRLINSMHFDCGIVLLRYEPNHGKSND